MPTLIIHLRPDNQQVSSPRSFRRRSHENPYAARSASTVLFFRSGIDDPVSIQQWAKDIQFYLNACVVPQNSTSPLTPTQHSFPEVSETSSIFFVNGEPNTALLSPSLRSRCSDLSSIPSDRRSLSSSSISELPSPRIDDHIHEHHGRTGLHIATNSEEFDLQQFDSRGQIASGSSDYKRSYKRETILDRYFSSYAIPVPVDTPTSSSISRFEALMTEMESKQGGRKNSLTSLSIPQTISSPTLRALEFVSTGIYHPDDIPESRSNSPRQSLAYPEGYRPQRSGVSSNYSQSRRNSDSSTGDYSAEASSITGGLAGAISGSFSETAPGQYHLSCASPRGKRRSIGDFSVKNSTSGSAMSVVGQGGTGIHMISEMTHQSNDEPILAQMTSTHNLCGRNENPLQSASAGYF